MTFRDLPACDARWRPLEGAGIEHLTLRPAAEGLVARSVVVGARGGTPYGVRYAVRCDRAWRVRQLDLEVTDGRSLHLASDGEGRWTDGEGRPLPVLDGCIDIDLAGTPFTNTLPIRRLGMYPGSGPVELRMLYVPFDSFEPRVNRQRYRCLEPGHLYRYEAADRSFVADLPVDEDGLVLDYPTLFARMPLS